MTGVTAGDVLVLVLTVGAAARLTRLVGRDSFPPAARFREWVWSRWEDQWPDDLISCVYCVAVWVSAPVAVSAYLWGDTGWWRILAGWLTLSYLAAVLVRIDTRHVEQDEQEPADTEGGQHGD